MSQGLKVKGSTLRSKLEFAEERLGNTARQEVEDYLRSEGVRTLLDVNWYPFDLFDGLLRKLAADFFDGDLERLQEIGVYSAEQALSTTYEPYAMRGDFHQFLKRISSLHGRFYDAGSLEVVTSDEESCELLLETPQFSEADVQVAAGFYVGAAKFMGLNKARCRFSIGPGAIRFLLDWS